ncbi:DUF559 domain-containing protein [Brachybacterium sp. UMB0905]|nr:DUF559 domain-containing protein [Brachybacterium sp. UMB0905]
MRPAMLLAPHPFRGGPLLHRDQWLARGVTRRRLASPEFTTLIPGWSALSNDPPSVAAVARAVLERLAPHRAALCGPTAAELLGISLPPRLRTAATGRIHVLSLSANRLMSTSYRRIHRDGRGDQVPRIRLGDLLLSPPVEVLCQLAGDLTHAELVAACDAVLDHQRLQIPAPSPAVLRDELLRLTPDPGIAAREDAPSGAPRRALPGVRAMLRALNDARPNVLSPWETHTRLLLLRAGFPEPVPNLPIRDPVTGTRHILDLAYPALKICIEYDGDWHRTDRARFRRDRLKDAVLRRLGWEVVRITVEQAVRPESFLAHLRAVWSAMEAA